MLVPGPDIGQERIDPFAVVRDPRSTGVRVGPVGLVDVVAAGDDLQRDNDDDGEQQEMYMQAAGGERGEREGGQVPRRVFTRGCRGRYRRRRPCDLRQAVHHLSSAARQPMDALHGCPGAPGTRCGARAAAAARTVAYGLSLDGASGAVTRSEQQGSSSSRQDRVPLRWCKRVRSCSRRTHNPAESAAGLTRGRRRDKV